MPAATAPASAAARLERLPFSGYHKRIFFIIAIAFFFDSVDLGTMTFVLGSIRKEFGLSTAAAGSSRARASSEWCSARRSPACSPTASAAGPCSSGAWCCGARPRICARPRRASTR